MAVDDSYTKSLLHLNGENFGTVFTDESGKTWSSTNATTTTGSPKFGTACLALSSGHNIYTGLDSDFDVHNVDFTIDFWAYVNSSNGGRWISSYTEPSAVSKGWVLKHGGWGDIAFQAWDNDGTETHNKTWSSSFWQGGWHHIALVRNSNVYSLYVDGTKQDVDYNNSTDLFYNTGENLYIGTDGIQGADSGKFDEFRFSKGIARWTADFTPPTGEYVAAPTYDESLSESFAANELFSDELSVINVSLSESIALAEIITSQITDTIDANFLLGDTVFYGAFYEEAISESVSMASSSQQELWCIGELSSPLPVFTVSGYTGAVLDQYLIQEELPGWIAGYTGAVGSVTFPLFGAAGYTGAVGAMTMDIFTAEGTVRETFNWLTKNIPQLELDGVCLVGGLGSFDHELPEFSAIGYVGAQLVENLWASRTMHLLAHALTGGIVSLSEHLPSLDILTSHANVDVVCSLSEQLPAFDTGSMAVLHVIATMNKSLPKFGISCRAYGGDSGSLAYNLPMFRISSTAYVSNGTVSFSKLLPQLFLVADAHGGQAGYYSVPVLNVRKGAVSEWNLGFNSITFFNGKTVATDGTKIYEIGGTTDDVSTPDADITANIKTGNLDLAARNGVRFTDSYANVKADGNLSLQFELDESATYNFTMTMHDLDDAHEEKVNLGRGMKARVYAVGLYNVDGSKFRINRLHFIGEKLD